jgi:nucleoside-diphosphate-sugar epimerase
MALSRATPAGCDPRMIFKAYPVRVKSLPPADLSQVLALTRNIWEPLRGGRIFLSGGTGFFGTWLLETFVHCNRVLGLESSATVLCRDPQGFHARFPELASEPSLEFLEGDVRCFRCPDQDFRFVIHAAAPTTADRAPRPAELLSVLIDGTRNMLELARNRNTKRFLFVSSGAVYGPQPSSMSHVPEEYQGGPNWLQPAAAYAEGKRVSEQLCSIAAAESELRLAIARCFAFVGPRLPLDQHFAIGNFISDALANRRIVIRGDGSPMRSYLYASDLAVWLWTLLLAEPNHAGMNPVVVNVGSGVAHSILEVARTVAKAMKSEFPIEVACRPAPDAPRLQYVPDVSRAEALYGLRQTVDLDHAVRRTASWHQSSN